MFTFILAQEDQIQSYTISDASQAPSTSFVLRFEQLRDNGYLSKFPGRKEYVFQHFISHFLPTFIGGKCPRISVQCGDEARHYPEDINSIVHRRSPELPLETTEYGVLRLTLLECDKLASADLKGTHFVHFIAHDRTVESQSIDGKLGLKLFGKDGDRVFHAILTGEYLDQNVNQERMAFMFEDIVLDSIISDVCWTHIEKFLEEPLASLSSDQRVTIKAIAESYPSVVSEAWNSCRKKSHRVNSTATQFTGTYPVSAIAETSVKARKSVQF